MSLKQRIEKVNNTSYSTEFYDEIVLIKDLWKECKKQKKAIKELTEREAKLVGALEFYADKENYDDGGPDNYGGRYECTIEEDYGQIAQAALNASTAPNNYRVLVDSLGGLVNKVKTGAIGIVKRELVESSEFKKAEAALSELNKE